MDERTTSKEARSGLLRFDVDCALLFQLGEQLVAKRYVALAELIKNSYDADATRTSVEFKQVAKAGGEIIISDDGQGMSLDTIRRSWMRIATSEKTQHPLSDRYRRPRAGAKGIGRFAARRLAGTLVLDSVTHIDRARPRLGRERTVVLFRWDDFKPGKLVQEVPVSFRHDAALAEGPTGVTLRLRQVRDAWGAEDIKALRADLIRLISPMPPELRADGGGERDPGFTVELQSEEFPAESGSLSEQFLGSALAVLRGRVDERGVPTYSVKFRGHRRQTYLPERRFKKIGRARFEVRFFVYKRDYFGGLLINFRDAQALGREQGGVHIYMDRFRVPPYGGPGDDWLKLDENRAGRLDKTPPELRDVAGDIPRPMLALPGNNQVFGRVFLSRFLNPNVHQTLNRERLLENEAFEKLREFVRRGIDWMTVLYARDTTQERESAKHERESPLRLLDRAEEKVEEELSDIEPERRAQIVQAIKLARASLEEEHEEHISELSMLRVLASTGTMIVVFDHQLMGVLEGLRESHRNLQAFIRKVSEADREKFQRVLRRLSGWIEDARHQGELLGLLLGRSARYRRRRLAVRPVVASMAEAFINYMQNAGIDFQNNVPAGVRTPPMFECELSAIVINLMTNALKAVRNQPTRRIGVEAEHHRQGVLLRFKDTGVGAKRSHWSEYFKAFVSESEPDPLLGAGTGLGLKIVRDFVDIYGGEARFMEPPKGWSTCIEILLPGGE